MQLNRIPTRPLALGLAAVATLAVTPLAGAAFLANGDLEIVTGNDFANWTEQGVVDSPTVLAGSHSAKLTKTTNANFTQAVSDPDSELSYWEFTTDLAVLSDATQRSFQVNLHHAGGNINLIVKTVGSNSEIWLYNQARVGGADFDKGFLVNAVDFSTDGDGNGDLSGGSDVLRVNTLRLVGDYRATPTFDVHVTDADGVTHSATGLAVWQNAAPAPGATLTSVSFQSGNLQTGKYAIVDDIGVGLVPEPASLALVGVGTGLVLLRRR